MLITVVTLRYQCQSFLDTAEPFYFTVSVNQLHINAKVSWQLIWKQMFQRNRDNSRNSSLKFLDFFFFSWKPRISVLQLCLHTSAWMSLINKFSCKQQPSVWESHFLFTLFICWNKIPYGKIYYFGKMWKNKSFVLFCEKKQQQQQQNPKHFRILFSVKN